MEFNYKYSIGEFSKLTGLPIRTLRYYDEIGLLPAIYKDPETGFRYYNDVQYIYIDYIKRLKDLGFSLKQIKEFLYDKELGVLENIFQEKVDEITSCIRKLENDLLVANDYLSYIQYVKKKNIDLSCKIRKLSKRKYLFTSARNWKHGDQKQYFDFYRKFQEFEKGYSTTGWYFYRFYENFKNIISDGFDFDLCRFLKTGVSENTCVHDLPEGEYAIIGFRGDFSRVVPNYIKLKDFAEQSGYKVISPPYLFFAYFIFLNKPADDFRKLYKQMIIRVEKY